MQGLAKTDRLMDKNDRFFCFIRELRSQKGNSDRLLWIVAIHDRLIEMQTDPASRQQLRPERRGIHAQKG